MAHSFDTNESQRIYRFHIHITLVHLMVAEDLCKDGGSVVSHQRKECLAPVTIEINIQMKVTACFIHSVFLRFCWGYNKHNVSRRLFFFLFI